MSNNLPDSVYKDAWLILAQCFGEWDMSNALKFMDSILQSVKLDFEERQDAIQNKTANKI